MLSRLPDHRRWLFIQIELINPINVSKQQDIAQFGRCERVNGSCCQWTKAEAASRFRPSKHAFLLTLSPVATLI